MGCDDCSEALASATAESFFRKVNEQNVPLSATLELTYRCNFKCVHCYCVIDGARTPAAAAIRCAMKVVDFPGSSDAVSRL